MDAGRMANAPNRLTARVEIPAACGGRKPNKVSAAATSASKRPLVRLAGIQREKWLHGPVGAVGVAAGTQGGGVSITTSAMANTRSASAEPTPITRRIGVSLYQLPIARAQYISDEKHRTLEMLSILDETVRGSQPSVRCGYEIRPERRLSLTARLV